MIAQGLNRYARVVAFFSVSTEDKLVKMQSTQYTSIGLCRRRHHCAACKHPHHISVNIFVVE